MPKHKNSVRLAPEQLEHIINTIYLLAVIIILPMLVASFSRMKLMELNVAMVYHIVISSCVGVVFVFRHRIAYQWKVNLIIFSLLGMSVLGVLSFGFLSTGLYYIALAAIVSSLFFERMVGFWVLLVGVVAYAFTAWLYISGRLSYHFSLEHYVSNPWVWIMAALSMCWITVSIIIINSQYQQLMRLNHTNYIQEIKKSEEQLRLLTDNIIDVIWKLDVKTLKFTYMTPSITLLRGLTVEEALAEPMEESVLPEYVDVLKNELIETIQQYYTEGTINPKGVHQLQQRCKDGRIIWVEVTSSLIFDEAGNPMEIIGVSRDVTQRKELEKQIFIQTTKAQEDERERIAKDLHDGVGPLLSVSKIYLHNIKNQTTDEIKEKSIVKLEQLLGDSLKAIKEISTNISPHILRTFGLPAALDDFIDKISPLTSTEIKINSEIACRIPDIYEISLYRIVTELINNSLKYAKPQNIEINLLQETELVTLRYFDNGEGVDLQALKARGSGLENIESRVKSLNGSCLFESHHGKGFLTTIKLYVEV